MAKRRTGKKTKPENGRTEAEGGIRLQKVLQRSGAAGRRASEELIRSGRVSVNGRVVTDIPFFVDPDAADVRLDGERLKSPRMVYLALNKPRGRLCTNNAEEGRRVADLVPTSYGRLHTVGRLDANSEGLIFITNDGEFTKRVTHPRYKLEKVYEVVAVGKVDDQAIGKLRRGVHLSDGRARCAAVKTVRAKKGTTTLVITLTEGRNRQIRRMLAACGLKVKRLIRLSVGGIRLGKLKTGRFRKLTANEITRLKGR